MMQMRESVRAIGTTDILRELLGYRQLLLSLAWRDIRVRYKQSVLGIAWAVLQPMSMMLVFSFVFTRAIDARAALAVDMPYALYAFAGLVPWTFFSASLGGCVQCLVANRNLVTKVYFPREVFPLASIASCLVDFCIAMIVLFLLMAYFHLSGTWTVSITPAIMFLPVIITIQIALTVGLGMMLGMANLFYRDVRHLFSVGIQLGMFVSAVVVPVPRDGSTLASIIAINPLVPLIEAYRDCLLWGRVPDLAGLSYALAVSVAVLLVGWILFRRASARFAEII
jgi:ABC-type polysaccharide/polyol phosphate export permease